MSARGGTHCGGKRIIDREKFPLENAGSCSYEGREDLHGSRQWNEFGAEMYIPTCDLDLSVSVDRRVL